MNARCRYLALGDSYTIGEGVDPAERWPVVLVGRLRTLGLPLAEPRIVATTGWTMDELEAALDREPPVSGHEQAFDLVSLLIGVNDQYRGLDRGRFDADYARLLDRAVALAGGEAARVFAVSIPDWGLTPFGMGSGRDLARVAGEIDWCNAAQARHAAARGVAWHDITALTREAGPAPVNVVDDGLHPSPGIYQAWVDLLEKAVAAQLAGQLSGGSGRDA